MSRSQPRKIQQEAARILAGYEFERTIEFICFACEENSGKGGRVYVLNLLESNAEVIGCFNYDMIAWSGADPAPPDLIIDTNEESRYLAAVLRDAALHYLPQDLEPFITEEPLGGSDHARFWFHDLPAIQGIESYILRQ